MINVSCIKYLRYIEDIFKAHGAPSHIAQALSEHLVRSDQRGHASHGVNRVPQYLDKVSTGALRLSSEPEVVSDSPGILLIDAHHGVGQYTTRFALEETVAKAKAHGVAACSISHSTHVGRLGEYVERAASENLVSIITTGSAGLDLGWMMPPGGNRKFVGANPWAFGFPADRHPVVFDASVTNVAQGKIKVAGAKGEDVPEGLIVDKHGRSTTVPADFYDDGALEPLGGNTSGHKGYGLGIVSALLGGLGTIGDANPTPVATNLQVKDGVAPPREGDTFWMAGVFLAVIDPGYFGASEVYRAEVSQLRRSSHLAHLDESAITFPGEYEDVSSYWNKSELKIPEATHKEILELGERAGIEWIPGNLDGQDGSRNAHE